VGSSCGSMECRADRPVRTPLRLVVVEVDPVLRGTSVRGREGCVDVVDRFDTVEGAALAVAACLPDVAVVAFDPQTTSPECLAGLGHRAPTTMLAVVTPGTPCSARRLIAAGAFAWYPASTSDLARAVVDDHLLFSRGARGLTVLAPVAARVPVVAASG
jgi:hypothetical protein